MPAMHESSKKELIKSQQQLESKIEEPFTGGKEELQLMVEQHSAELGSSSDKRDRVSIVGGGRGGEGHIIMCACIRS